MREAKYWGVEGDEIRCHLCPQECLIEDDKRGICNVRKNIDGKLYSLIYGKAASLAVDPIEKKPLYHFYPGSQVLSYGTMGCNLKCKFCQNASLSNGDTESPYLKEYSVEELANKAMDYEGIAWTYNEPTIAYEYSYDVSKRIKETGGGYVVYVTNGYINDKPLKDLSPYLDAMNIDIKAFHDDFPSKRSIISGDPRESKSSGNAISPAMNPGFSVASVSPSVTASASGSGSACSVSSGFASASAFGLLSAVSMGMTTSW